MALKRFLKIMLVEIFFLCVISLIIVFIFQASVVVNPQQVFGLIMDPRYLILNLLIISVPLSLCRCFFSRKSLTVFTLIFATGLAIINHTKIYHIGEPILATDIFIMRESFLLLDYLTGLEYLALLGIIIFPCAVIFRLYSVVSNKGKNIYLRALCFGGFCFAFFMVFLNSNSPAQKIFIQIKSEIGQWQRNATIRYGFFLNIAANAWQTQIQLPKNYSKEKIKAVMDTSFSTVSQQAQPKSVVVILLESFDELAAPNIKTQRNYLPHYRKISKIGEKASFFSPVFGGRTADAEFEVLTGLSMKFLPAGSSPYTMYIKKSMPSLVRAFSKNGYKTIAIHANTKNYWNREQVYRHLGFHNFYGKYDLDEVGSHHNPSVRLKSDRVIFEKSLSLLQSGPALQFHFLITLSTHGPYKDDPNKKGKLVPEISVYMNRMQALDSELGDYFQSLRALPNPPAVLLFSDHQPHFKQQLNNGRVDRSLYRVAAIAWNSARATLPPNGGGLYCLSSAALRAGNLSLSPFFNYIDNFCKNDSQFNEKGFQLLIFDRLFGNQYSENISK